MQKELIIIKVEWANKRFLTFLKKVLCRVVRAVLYTGAVFLAKVAKWRAPCLLKFLHSHINCQFKSLADIIVYDTPHRLLRYTLVYNLLSTVFNKRLLVVVYTKNTVRSVCSIYAGAGWSEREA